MGARTKIALAASFVGVVVTAAAAFGQTGSGTDKTAAKPDKKSQRSPDECGGANAGRRAERLVHSDTKVKTKNGFALITVDQGTVTAVDHHSKTITIERADGEKVTATAVDETKVCKDGKT